MKGTSMDRRLSMTAVMAAIVLTGMFYSVTASAQDNAPLLFNTSDHGEPGNRAPVIEPWRAVPLDTEYGGLWVVTGDIDNDGEVEIVSAQNVNVGDVHYTSAVVAQELDGTVKWRWGNPAAGRRNWHHDVACQIYDWDGDTWNEVILLTKGALVELDGASGRELRRIPVPDDATDCIVFCNVSGRLRPTDVIVKNRYEQMWVYNYGGTLLWTVKNPGGYRTAHQPRPYDLDGDGKDEIMAGYSMLNSDGSVRWTLTSTGVDLAKGHLDCCRAVTRGKTPSEWSFVMTYCGAGAMAYVDGTGRTIWEKTGLHFESLDVGRVVPDVPELQVLVDIDHVPQGESPVRLYDSNGRWLGQIVSGYCRHHALLDWTGDGCEEIILADARGVFDGTGKRIATLRCDGKGIALQKGDMDGDGVPDIGIVTDTGFFIFRNTGGVRPEKAPPLGCGVNYTLY